MNYNSEEKSLLEEYMKELKEMVRTRNSFGRLFGGSGFVHDECRKLAQICLNNGGNRDEIDNILYNYEI